VGATPPTNSNDGASCALAPPPPGLADVDGPEPETEPSTPQAKAAAKEYEETYEPTPIWQPTNQPADPKPEADNPEQTYYVQADTIEGGETCGPSPLQERPPRRALQEITTVDVPTTLYRSGFDEAAASDWEFLSGDWSLSAGTLDQTTDCDFDATALLATHTVTNFRWSTSFVANEGRNNGGVLFHQSSPSTRSGATVVDFADNGSTIRWGSYDNAGFYQFAGMQEFAPAATGQVVRLSVIVNGSAVGVFVDDVAVANFASLETAGMVGLITTKSSLSFENVELVALPAESAQAEEAATGAHTTPTQGEQ